MSIFARVPVFSSLSMLRMSWVTAPPANAGRCGQSSAAAAELRGALELQAAHAIRLATRVHRKKQLAAGCARPSPGARRRRRAWRTWTSRPRRRGRSWAWPTSAPPPAWPGSCRCCRASWPRPRRRGQRPARLGRATDHDRSINEHACQVSHAKTPSAAVPQRCCQALAGAATKGGGESWRM